MGYIHNPVRHSIVQNIMNLIDLFRNFLDLYHSPTRVLEGNGIN